MSLHALSKPGVDDLKDLLALLDQCVLPFADLEARHLAHFLICRNGGRLIAAAGLEFCDKNVLLRSLAVAPGFRQRGLASRLVEALEQRALATHQEQLFLMTTTAQDFFTRRGFRPLARTAVPAAIANTAQFRRLCPTSAVCMVKALGCASHRQASS